MKSVSQHISIPVQKNELQVAMLVHQSSSIGASIAVQICCFGSISGLQLVPVGASVYLCFYFLLLSVVSGSIL
jgi:hypothetical protein